MQQVESHQEKLDTQHVEKIDGFDNVAMVTAEGAGLLKSRFDEMSIPRTLWVFRRVVLVTLAVYTGYMCEGFEVGS
jgi:SP family general alpha glucoside:H+ symporter-like MFS transporter